MTSAFEPTQPDPWMPPQPLPPVRTRTNLWHLFFAGLAGAALVGALWVGLDLAHSGSPSAPGGSSGETFDLRGTFTLNSSGYGYSACGGSGDYSDITTGTAVTVYDAAGTVLSQGALGTGRPDGAGTCVFSLAAPNVPSGEKFYLVEVSHRGRIMVQPEDARAGKVALTLGN
ncbi:hypothetical protein SAMN04489727_8194 [Amycolatopsis tolypomycina]|uniref:Uncharacterized protein n=1 Tax=Amycolatopsis tolypomycina TaxID=208445 RepID=A0A1H5BC66_9PSEU|nr:hypothetical protein [Amycolatopsis tolypomycina]SED51821.1 hypothetical protein SAMN04489727_8194 [Amycolatopsis tolypomycina]